MKRNALLALFIGLVAILASPLLAQNNPDTAVWSDKNNYVPGEVVTVTGVGFQPGEVVNLVFHVDGREDRTSTANADENGGFTNNTFSPDSLDAEATIKLIAAGTASGFEAINYFLDGPPLPSCAGGFTVDWSVPASGTTFSKIQDAVDAIPTAGGPCVITVKAGTYKEHVVISGRNTTAASDSQRVLIRRDPAATFGTVTVSSTGQTGSNKQPFLVQSSKFITIQGLKITGNTDTGVAIGAGCADITVAANEITDNKAGILVTGSQPRIWLYNNFIHDNSGDAISILGPNPTPSYFVNNTIYANSGRGIQVAGGISVLIINNLIVANTGLGIQQQGTGSGAGAALYNNMLYRNNSPEITAALLDEGDSGNYVTLTNLNLGIAGCTFSDCTSTRATTAVLDSTGHLAASSPALDKGLNSFVDGVQRVPSIDVDGDTRPVNSTVDIGADEAPLSNPPGVPTITGKPTDPTNQTSATFTFVKNSGDTGTITFECALDSSTYQACESGAQSATYAGLSDGRHTFSVRAKNPAGTSAPAQYSWTVDTIAGDLTITDKPADPTKSTSATFKFESTDASATFECKLDSGSYASCSSPFSRTGLAEGPHTFSVKATDNVGNSTSQSYTWHIDTTAPTLDISRVTAANGDGWNKTAVQLTVTCTDTNGVASLTASGSATGSGDSPLNLTISTEGADQSVTAKCTDNAGNEATKSLSQINIDLTKPVITGSRTPDANANGWNNIDVTVSFACADTGSVQSGIATDTVAGEKLTAEGQNLSVQNTGACTDKAGNSAEPVTVSNINIDKTPPNPPSTQVTPAPNAAGWNNATPVTIKFNDAGDAGSVQSGIASCTSNAVLSSETSGTDESGTCTDKAGNVSTAAKVTVKIDTTRPEITYTRMPAANSYGWNNTNVTVAFACADKGTVQSGVGTNTVGGDNTVSTEGASQSVSSSGSCTDNADNAAEAVTVSNINIDKTAPTINASRTPAPNANGWNSTDVKASYTASDALSGLVEPDTGSYDFTAEGAGQTHTFEVTDKAGNKASAEIKDVNIDKTAPTVTAAPSPAANANGWNNTNVTVTFAGTDSVSGIDHCDDPAVLTSEGAGQSATGKCTDKAGNTGAGSATNINIDKTAPAITLASRLPAANTYGWNNTNVTATWGCTDALSGATASSVSLATTQEGAGQTLTGSCADKAGNSAADTVSGINIDWTKPTLYPTINPNPPILNGFATASDGATDLLSGLVTHSCTQLDTTSVGSKTLTCSATDKAGNSASQAVTYTVTYLSGGVCMGDAGHTILQPINADGNSVFKQKSTVPAKFRVCDANGVSIGTVGVVSSFRLIGAGVGTVSDVDEAVVSTTPDTAFRWDPTSAQWIFNMNTKTLTAGMTYVYRIILNDGTPIDFRFGLK